ncbi:peptidase S28 [Trichodelitschia bisporula]|uniref:Peptidase S28 n=1 Tax=Trichodelitschia bisporula TaxID=703511 RepID=A0A6G1I5I0_9PEZI|nr:peptidase S28 [Trichodelitschia bisporula]
MFQLQSGTIDEAITAETVQLPVDHWDPDAGTFPNRFWVSETHYKPGGPVMIFDAGEGAADGTVSYLTSPRSFFKQMLAQFGAIGIVWEHRYYGESTPVKVNLTTPSAAFEFLDTEQALADIPAFAWNFTRKKFPSVDLTPKSTPWVFVGGSYPGMRASFVRDMYPETIYASYASSAPVQASIDMSFYFEPIWAGLHAKGYGNCSADIHAAILEIDNIMADNKTGLEFKEKMFGKGAGVNSNGAIADALTTLFGEWQSYGVDDRLSKFCNYISTDPESKAVSGATGWAPSKGAGWVVGRWIAYPEWLTIVNNDMKTTCSPAGGECDFSKRTADPDAIAWTWQYCTQWGFFQTANLGDHQLVSKYNSLEHAQDWCHTQFPDGAASGFLPSWPKVEETNQRYDGWDARPSNVYWTGGQFDPWRTLSPLSDMDFSNKVQAVQTVPACEKSDGSLFGYLVPDAEHCFDFRLTFEAGKSARQLFNDALTEWLKCFKSGAGKPVVNSRLRRVESGPGH